MERGLLKYNNVWCVTLVTLPVHNKVPVLAIAHCHNLPRAKQVTIKAQNTIQLR